MKSLSNKARGTKFEEEIKGFFNRLEFEDVQGGHDNLIINNHQIDVIAGHEKSLIIVECTSTKDVAKKPLRDKIKEFRGIISFVEKGLKVHEIYKKYKYYYYLLAVNNYELRDDDTKYANAGDPRIYICDDNFIIYYNDLFDKIQKYAKYDLLGEIGIKPTDQSIFQVPAFKTQLGKSKIYYFITNPRYLLEFSYVARRDSKRERYYQRIINKDKLIKIATFISKGNILPNNLIISFGEHLKRKIKFHESAGSGYNPSLGINYGLLEFPKDYRSCWIIDGQHRLYAFAYDSIHEKPIFNMPVVAFENLEIDDQGKLFLDINKNQKPVPADLVWDLNGDMIPREEDGIISNIVKDLNNMHNSLLYHKIYIPSKGLRKTSGLLKIAGMCLSFKRAKIAKEITYHKTQNPFYSSIPESFARNVSNNFNKYLIVIKSQMPDDWEKGSTGFILNNQGMSVLIGLFEKLASHLITIKATWNEDYLNKYIKPVSSYLNSISINSEGIKELKNSIVSLGGKEILLKKLFAIIQKDTEDSSFGGMMESDAVVKIKELERKLKILINVLLSNVSPKWTEEELVPIDIRKRSSRYLEKRGINDKTQIFTQFTLGDCFQIIKHNKNYLYQYLIYRPDGFAQETDLENAFAVISRNRTEAVHDVGDVIYEDDDAFLDLYIKKFEKIFSKNLDTDIVS